MSEQYTNIKTETAENSEVVITGEITVEASGKFRTKALKEINENITIDGFRKGNIPEKIIVEKVGEAYILEETAELALKTIAPEIIEKNTPNYVGRPKIEIIKLAPQNPIGFKITVGILPTFKLPDYVKIAKTEMAKEVELAEVSDKDLEGVVEEVRKQHAHRAFHAANPSSQNATAGEAGHDHTPEAIEKHMPDFTDEFVKSIGNFESVSDFKSKAKENMLKEKQQRNIEKRRGNLLEALVAKTDIKLPPAIVESELDRMYAQFEQDITGMGLKTEDYFKHIKKTQEQLRKDWLPDAEKRAKLNLILAEIAKTEKVVADKDAVDLEVKTVLERFKDVDPLRVEAYVEHSLTIEKVIQFLESQK